SSRKHHLRLERLTAHTQSASVAGNTSLHSDSLPRRERPRAHLREPGSRHDVESGGYWSLCGRSQYLRLCCGARLDDTVCDDWRVRMLSGDHTATHHALAQRRRRRALEPGWSASWRRWSAYRRVQACWPRGVHSVHHHVRYEAWPRIRKRLGE